MSLEEVEEYYKKILNPTPKSQIKRGRPLGSKNKNWKIKKYIQRDKSLEYKDNDENLPPSIEEPSTSYFHVQEDISLNPKLQFTAGESATTYETDMIVDDLEQHLSYDDAVKVEDCIVSEGTILPDPFGTQTILKIGQLCIISVEGTLFPGKILSIDYPKVTLAYMSKL